MRGREEDKEGRVESGREGGKIQRFVDKPKFIKREINQIDEVI